MSSNKKITDDYEKIRNKIGELKKIGVEVDLRSENRIDLQVEYGNKNVGTTYLVFLFGSDKDIKIAGEPTIFKFIKTRDNKIKLYIKIKKYEEDRWIEYDIDKEPIEVLNKLFVFLEKNHSRITGPYDKKLEEFVQRIIDSEKRVKEGGLLIAAYINYLESNVRSFKKKIPLSWGAIVLQLMVLYFLHKKGVNEKINELKFGVIEAYEEYSNGEKIDPEGYEIWELLGKDLKKFHKISKESIFSFEEWKELNHAGITIQNKYFLGNKESLRKFKFENIKSVLKKFDRELSGKGKSNFKSVQRELWKKFKEIGIIPLFEVRRWYEEGLIGEVIGGIYEGVKKIEERKKGGIYYTPHFIVKYIVDAVIEMQIKDIITKISNYNNFDEFITNATTKQKEKLYEKLSNLKIIDPACGTGHFLIYSMKKLQYYYKKIRDNADSGTFKVEILDRNGRKQENLIKIKDEALPFVIRQHLILRNNIYGVDIDENAILIAKSRMLIEIFELYNKQVKKAGYELPNLDMNLKVGNSLIGFTSWQEIPEENKGNLFYYMGDGAKIDEIKRIIKKVKETGDLRGYNKKIEKLRDVVNDLFIEYLKKKIKISKEELLKLKPFHWIIEFPNTFQFDTNECGFDIVIENPPYVKLQKRYDAKRKYGDIYEPFDYKTFDRNGDLYVLFYERGLQLTKESGFLGFISSNKWMRAGYGKLLRKLLSEKSPKVLIDIGPNVFPEATVDTNILIIKNEKEKKHNLKAIKLNGAENFDKINEIEVYTLTDLSEKSWIIASPIELEIKKYIEKVGTPLRDWDINIYRGVLTGFNDAFIIDGEKRKELIKKDPKSAEIIKPLLRGRDIERYRAKFADKWLIATFPALNLNIDDYPAVKEYLSSFGERLLQDGLPSHRKKTSNKWFETQDQIGYYEEFEKEKIVYREISGSFNATIISSWGYINNKLYLIKGGSLKYLLLTMNSKLYNSSIFGINITGGKGSDFLSKLHILKISHNQQKPFEHLVDILLFKKQLNMDTTYEEKLVDYLVYELYFKEKFHEDGLYPKAKNYLLEAVAKHLKSIEYDRWAKLYWKKQIEGKLSKKEERELEKLEKENMKTIERVVKKLKEDKEVQKWIKKIKSHKWVKVIEGEEIS